MLESLFIMLEIIAFVFAAKAYHGFASEDKQFKATIFWIFSAVVFSINALAAYNIQVTLDASIISVAQIPIAVFNWPMAAFMIFMFFIDTFNKGFE